MLSMCQVPMIKRWVKHSLCLKSYRIQSIIYLIDTSVFKIQQNNDWIIETYKSVRYQSDAELEHNTIENSRLKSDTYPDFRMQFLTLLTSTF